MKAKFTVFRSIFSVNKSEKSRADIVVKVEETIRDEEIFKAPLLAKIRQTFGGLLSFTFKLNLKRKLISYKNSNICFYKKVKSIVIQIL